MVGSNIREHPASRLHEILAPPRSGLDLADFGQVKRFLDDHKPDIVIHAAGMVGGIKANSRFPVRFLVENMDIGRNVVMASAETGVTKLLNLGSSCMYPKTDTRELLTEEMLLSGRLEPTNEAYALAKIAVARLCEYLNRENPNLHYRTLIPCNLYGRWDRFDPDRAHLIPAVVHKLHRAKEAGVEVVQIWGDGTARREFMYAGDLADCVYYCLDHFDAMPDTMNVGLGHDLTVNEYYHEIARVVGYKGRFTHDLSQPAGVFQKCLNIDRLKRFGWTPQTTLADGLQKTYEFYLQEVVGRYV